MKSRSCNKYRAQLHRYRSRIGVRALPDGRHEVIKTGRRDRDNTVNVKAETEAERRKRRIRTRKRIQKIAACVIGAELVVLAGLLAWRYCPVAIAIDGEDACYLKNEMQAEEALEEIITENAPPGTKVTASKFNDNIEIKRSIGFGRDYLTAGQAKDLIWNDYLLTDKSTITTKSRQTITEDYIPEIDYRQDENMVAGQKRVEFEGVKGSQTVTRQYTVENGELLDQEILKTDITDAGQPAIIYKGMLGLPEGEDWRTYEGMPVYKNGEELITDAQHYLGLRYVWGGFNLNKGVDCVGFVVEMYKKFGITLPKSHEGLRKTGVAVKNLSDAKAGDIICYNGHVALYMGNGKVIHATRGSSNNVHISDVNYTKKRHIITIRRVVE